MPLMFDFTKMLSGFDFTSITVYFLGTVGIWALIVICILLFLKGSR